MDYVPFIQLKQETIYQASFKSKKIDSVTTVANYARELIGEMDRETVLIFGLNTKSEINFISIVSVGTLNSSMVHPREIFKASILSNCSRIVISHNHPSGDIEPSKPDKSFTDRIVAAGELIGIEVLDHVIVSASADYYSFAEHGYM